MIIRGSKKHSSPGHGVITFPPYKCDMPNLSELNNKLLFLWFKKWAVAGGPPIQKSYALGSSFIRVLNQTINQYTATRKELLLHVEHPEKLVHYFNSMTYLESCIIFLKRTLRFVGAIKRDYCSPRIKGKRYVLSNGVINKITTLRDDIEHMDERLIKGNNGIMSINEKDFDLFGTEVTYNELATWISQLYEIAAQFLQEDTHKILLKT